MTDQAIAAVPMGEGQYTDIFTNLVDAYYVQCYTYGYSDLCGGMRCNGHDYWCASNCCTGNYCSTYGYYNGCDYDSYNYGWLWWTLSGLFFCLCIMSMVGAAKRRRMQQYRMQ